MRFWGLKLVFCCPRQVTNGWLDRPYKVCSGLFDQNEAYEGCFRIDTQTWSPQDDIARTDLKQRLAGGGLRKPWMDVINKSSGSRDTQALLSKLIVVKARNSTWRFLSSECQVTLAINLHTLHIGTRSNPYSLKVSSPSILEANQITGLGFTNQGPSYKQIPRLLFAVPDFHHLPPLYAHLSMNEWQ